MTIQDHLSLDGINDDNLSIFKAIDVDYVAVMHPPPPKPGDRADIWKDVRKQVESHGMKFNNVGLRPAKEITLGKPGRDEHINNIFDYIEEDISDETIGFGLFCLIVSVYDVVKS